MNEVSPNFVSAQQNINKVPGTSSRILLDIPCKVCQDHSSGKHYGIFACDGCAGFFKRSIRRNRQYICKARNQGSCPVDKTHRNQCRACRLKKCLESGMNKDAVQHERGPRNSTIRRQVALYLRQEASSMGPTGSALSAPGSGVSSEELSNAHAHFVSARATYALGGLPTPPEAANLSPSPASVSVATSLRPAFVCHPTPKYPHEVTPSYFCHPETICESAARLLFMNVKWAKSVPAFSSLPFRDQLMLLEESWRELFILAASQFFMQFEAGALFVAAGMTGEQCPPDKVTTLVMELRNLQEIIANFRFMRVDATEYAFLKAVVLFKTVFPSGASEVRVLRDIQAVSTLQDQAHLTLSKYIQSAYPTQPSRFGKLLLMLPTLRTVSSATIEDLFFKKTIGTIPIEKLLCDMYKSSDF